MKTSFMVLAVLISSPFSPASSAGTPTEACKKWKLTFNEQTKTNFSAGPFIRVLKTYPGEPESQSILLEDKTPPADQLARFSNGAICYPMDLFDAAKKLTSEKLSQKQQAEVKQFYFDQLRAGEARNTGLLNLKVTELVIQMLLDHHWVKLSDAAYFEFSRISDDLEKTMNALRREAPLRCKVSAECKDEDVKSDLERIRWETLETRRIHAAFLRWLNRINRNY